MKACRCFGSVIVPMRSERQEEATSASMLRAYLTCVEVELYT